MKKFVIIALLLGIVSGMVFAGEGFIVQSVAGKVEREVTPGKWVTVRAGETLTAATVVKTAVGAKLVLKGDDKTFEVPAMKKGTIESFAGVSVAGGIRLGGAVYESDTSENSRVTANSATASARASDAAADYVWEE